MLYTVWRGVCTLRTKVEQSRNTPTQDALIRHPLWCTWHHLVFKKKTKTKTKTHHHHQQQQQTLQLQVGLQFEGVYSYNCLCLAAWTYKHIYPHPHTNTNTPRSILLNIQSGNLPKLTQTLKCVRNILNKIMSQGRKHCPKIRAKRHWTASFYLTPSIHLQD